MSDDLASQASWNINSRTAGNKKLRRVQSYEVSSDRSTEAMGEVGNEQMVGFVDKPGACTITFEICETKGPKREVDWEKLDTLREMFSLTKQVKGGLRMQYPECKISKIDYSGEAEGKHMYTVEIIALGQKAM